MCPGWLLRKTILEGFRWSGNFALQESRSRRALHQGWKWAFKIEQFSIDKFDFVIVVHSGKAFSLSKIKNFNFKFENHISDYLSSSFFKTHWQSDVIDNTHAFLIIQQALIIFN